MSLQIAHASSLPNGFSENRLATGLDPTSMEFAPDGRLFVTEKPGRVRIIKNGTLLSTPFLTLSVNNNDERGLQSITFDPDFANNQYVYVYYAVSTSPVHNRVSRFKANGDIADPNSETVLLELDNLQASIHNGGAMFFSLGKLFITTGENGVSDNAQSFSSLLGKVLRINPDGSIPTDNPFYNTASGKYRAIWALGFRNPFKATVQPGTGRIFICDVGGGSYEEINEGFAGKNYGWPSIEGYRTNQIAPYNYQEPFYAYDHFAGCAITGGAFYNPATSQFPSSYVGKFFFNDYCNGYIKTLDVNGGAVADFATGINRAIAVKVGPDGSLYYLARGGLGGGSVEDNTSSNQGEVWRVQYSGSNVPTISAQPINQISPVGGAVTFTVGGSGTGLSYQWQRNGNNISGATASSYTYSPVSQGDNGAIFRVIVTNSSGNVTSNGATLTVTSNQYPTARILSPSDGTLYRAGDVITFSGSATDPEDGNLPASGIQWVIEFHHDEHTHPGPTPVLAGDGKSGYFTIPTIGETSYNVWYRIYMTVTDSQGGSSSTYVEVRPIVVALSLTTDPSGLQVNINGQPHTMPFHQSYVSGMSLQLDAPTTQTLNGTTYTFLSWTPSISADGQITVPNDNSVYTANYAAPGSLRDPENPANAVAGLDYSYYEGDWGNLPDFTVLPALKTGVINAPSLSVRQRDQSYGLRFTGYVSVPTDGVYTFYTSSDDGSKLLI
ncbi:PQQ-dependent sugar dehydrogenase, partial [Spirosoma flavum]